MKIFIFRVTAAFGLILSILALPIQSQAATNLVSNGGFESPVVSHPDKWDIFASGTSDLGWTVEWLPGDATTFNGATRPDIANLELQASGHLGFLPAEGNQWAELDTDWFGPNGQSQSEPASVKIYQDIATIPGNTYQLDFQFSPRPDAGDISQNILNIEWNNSHVDTISRGSLSGTQTEWNSYSYKTLVATASTTRLEFSDGGMPNSVGTYLDNVSLTDLGNGTLGTTTGTSTATSTDPGNGGGGGTGTTTATSTATSTDTGTATSTPVDSSGGGSNGGSSGGGSAPLTGYGSSGGGSSVGGGSSGGQVLGASIGPTSTEGQVLGASTSTLPSMPYTGTGANSYVTYFVSYLGLLLVSEALVLHFRKVSKNS